ncbi:MAG: hypothetical protein EA368_19455 [Leptolyngbya sp. DLM2.Bin27]|nr:MAG: hypothetical protein EA368_19455 [Leptolyngbya sp. DLM2.Bin27]
MPYRQSQTSSRLSKGVKGVISFAVTFLAGGLLLLRLFASMAEAFDGGAAVGLRSVAAAVLPLMVSIYLGFVAQPQMPVRDSRAPIINNFVIFLLWTMLIIGVDQRVGEVEFPLIELLYSLTLAAMLWRYRYLNSLKSLIAASYGVLAGALAAIVLFGRLAG